MNVLEIAVLEGFICAKNLIKINISGCKPLIQRVIFLLTNELNSKLLMTNVIPNSQRSTSVNWLKVMKKISVTKNAETKSISLPSQFTTLSQRGLNFLRFSLSRFSKTNLRKKKPKKKVKKKVNNSSGSQFKLFK